MSRRPTDLSIMAVDMAEGFQGQKPVHVRPEPTRRQRKGCLLLPVAWAKALATMPPECHAVAYCLLHRRRHLHRGEPRIAVGTLALTKVGITWRTKPSAFRLLEAAGLIAVKARGERKSPYVTLHKLE